MCNIGSVSMTTCFPAQASLTSALTHPARSVACHLDHTFSQKLWLGSISACCLPGQDPQDATSSSTPVQDYTAALRQAKHLASKPLQGKRIGVIAGMMSSGVAAGVATAVQNSIKHLESLGADMCEVRFASAYNLASASCQKGLSPSLQ